MPLAFGELADDDMCNMFGYFLRQPDICKNPEVADNQLTPQVIANCCEFPPLGKRNLASWITDQCE